MALKLQNTHVGDCLIYIEISILQQIKTKK